MSRADWKPVVDRRRRVARIPLFGTLGGFAIVDVADAELAHEHRWECEERADGYGNRYRYAVTTLFIDGRREVRTLGRILLDAGSEDHVGYKNEDRLDNRRANLHLGSKADVEHSKRSRGGTSKYKGVYLDKSGRWVGTVSVNRRKIKRRFAAEKEAALWVDEQAREIYPAHAPKNFPRPGEKSALRE